MRKLGAKDVFRLRMALYKIFFISENRMKVLKAAETAVPAVKLDGTPKMRAGKQMMSRTYLCAGCGKDGFKTTEIQIDHVESVGPAPGSKYAPKWLNWGIFIERMLGVGVQLQVLCKKCHTTKTLQDKLEIRDGVWAKKHRDTYTKN